MSQRGLQRLKYFRLTDFTILLIVTLCISGCQVSINVNSNNPSTNNVLSNTKSISSFSIVTPGADGIVSESAKTISITIPTGTSPKGLIAKYATSGASVKVGTVTQVSGETANDFSSPVTYIVTAQDGSTADYIVTVTVAPSTSKEISTFKFASPDIAGIVSENTKTISVTMSSGTSPKGLIAVFSITGASVKVGTTSQVSGTTSNDFTSPVEYIVTASDGSTATYTVTVTISKATAKQIASFSFPSFSATGVIDESTKVVGISVPYGTNTTSLIATFQTTGESVKVGTKVQTSGTSPNDFTNTVAYTVTAADGSSSDYSVNVSIGLNSAKAITAFSFESVSATATIDEATKVINVSVPFGTDITTLVATFTTSGNSVKVGTKAQSSGVSANNHSEALTYTVTAADNTSATYTVNVSNSKSSAKEMTAFSFPNLSIAGTIDELGKTITTTVPFGTDVTALVPAFSYNGASVKVGTTIQASGVTANNFSNAVEYIVTAADTTTTKYTVTLAIAKGSEKTISAFSFQSLSNTGKVDELGKTIAVTVPYGTDVTALVADFSTTGANVKVGSNVQSSGISANNYSTSKTYTPKISEKL